MDVPRRSVRDEERVTKLTTLAIGEGRSVDLDDSWAWLSVLGDDAVCSFGEVTGDNSEVFEGAIRVSRRVWRIPYDDGREAPLPSA